MKKKWGALILGIALLEVLAYEVSADPQLRGYTLTDVYALEDATSTQHVWLYQTLSFRLLPLASPNLALVSHLRYQGDTADEFAESSDFKLHNLYLRWACCDRWDTRVGRQFLAEGVGFGTYDVVRMKYLPSVKSSLTLWGGLAAPLDRQADLQAFDQAPTFGAAVRGRLSDRIQLLGSYLHEESKGELFRHRAGLSTTVQLLPQVTVNTLVHVNLNGPSDLDRVRFLLRYNSPADWRLFGEVAMGTPELPANSPFQNIEMETKQWMRLGGAYQVTPGYWIGLRWQSFLSGNQPSTTLGLSLEGPWGMVGYRQRFGDFGEESGFFGSARYALAANAQIYASADYSVYNFDNDNEDQAAAQAGLRITPLKALQLDLSVQGLRNELYDQNFRGLLRVKWSFSN